MVRSAAGAAPRLLAALTMLSLAPGALGLVPSLGCLRAERAARRWGAVMCEGRPAVMVPLEPAPEQRLPIGRITSLERSKIETQPDSIFYSMPKLVTHADDDFLAKLQRLYGERLPKGAVVLDLMGSHVSHLPPLEKGVCDRLDVHGMNAEELRQNPMVLETGGKIAVHDLNADPSLPFAETGAYDAVLCALGVQYLEEPEQVFAEVARVLKPNTGLFLVSFSVPLFYNKAITGWIERGMSGRGRLVKDYMRAAGGFGEIEIVEGSSGLMGTLQGMIPGAGDPFGAVVGRRDGSS